MIVKNRRCARCRGQLYLEPDPNRGCADVSCLMCGRVAGTIITPDRRKPRETIYEAAR